LVRVGEKEVTGAVITEFRTDMRTFPPLSASFAQAHD